MDIAQLKRIADAMEEILRLVKKDMANVQKSIAEESEKIYSIAHYLPVVLVITKAWRLLSLFVLQFSH